MSKEQTKCHCNARISAEKYRERIQHEDTLLYIRLNYFLLLNGFAAVAIGLFDLVAGKIIISLAMFVINALAAFAIYKTDSVIWALYEGYGRDYGNDAIELLVQASLGPVTWLRPNRIMARIFPLVIVVGWAAGSIVTISSVFS